MTAPMPLAFAGLARPHRHKAFYGGRGSGKSHSFATQLLVSGALRPMRILCCREIQRSISVSVKQLLDDKIRDLGLSGHYVSTQYDIRGRNGTQFLFMGLRTNPDSVKSTEGIDVAWVEEANTVSQRSLDLLVPTVRKPGSELWFSWNRRHESDPVDRMFLGGQPPPGSLVREVSWRDNRFFPDVLREEMEWDRGRDRDKWLHVWEGHPVVRSEARVFRNWRVDDLDPDVPAGSVPMLGADWGFSVDPTVLVECRLWDRTLYVRREAWKVRCEIDETPSLFYGDDRLEPPRWLNPHGHAGLSACRAGHRIVADSSRPETISYMRARGFNITKARKGAGSVEEGVEFMRSHDIVVHPSCVHVVDELEHYRYRTDPQTEEVTSELVDRKNHTVDAVRYAVEGERRAGRGGTCWTAPEIVYPD